MASSAKSYWLWLLAAISLVGYTLLPIFFPLLGQFDSVPLHDIRTFAPSFGGGLAYGLLFLYLYAVYAIAWRHVANRGASVWYILAAALLFCLPLLLTYPINATDVFRYFIRGRVTTVYGESALLVAPSAFPQDPYLPLAGEWAGNTSPYGPLWEVVAAVVTIVSRQNLLSGLVLFKSLAAVGHLGIGALIWQAGKELPQKQRAANTLLWTWNPALLFMFAIDAHNDALMIFWLVMGTILMKRRPLFGFLIAVLGALIKPIALLALPFLFIGHWRKLYTLSTRLRYLLAAAAGTLILALVTFAPFGSPLELGMRLLQEASDAVGFSPGVLIILLAQRLGSTVSVDVMTDVGATLGSLLFLVLAVLLLWRVWRGMQPLRGVAFVFAAYVATALTFRIWYSTWPFAWLILSGDKNRRALSAGFWFLLTAHLSLLIYGHVRAGILAGNFLVAHLIGVPFTFILPVILAYRYPLRE